MDSYVFSGKKGLDGFAQTLSQLRTLVLEGKFTYDECTKFDIVATELGIIIKLGDIEVKE